MENRSPAAPAGAARQEAEALAAKIAGFPQIAMRSDRQSAYDQDGMDIHEALVQEDLLAREAKAVEARSGAARFAAGLGRHGTVDDEGEG